ncbi:MAG: hypothetical protein HQ581_14330, partial [Planctomycetes bacterium]|nr:hypothetical protein [Planctomycetota bacterium]
MAVEPLECRRLLSVTPAADDQLLIASDVPAAEMGFVLDPGSYDESSILVQFTS